VNDWKFYSFIFSEGVLRYENIIFWLYWGSHNSFIQNLFFTFSMSKSGNSGTWEWQSKEKTFLAKMKIEKKIKTCFTILFDCVNVKIWNKKNRQKWFDSFLLLLYYCWFYHSCYHYDNEKKWSWMLFEYVHAESY
jgi:hypothetical protein